MEALRRLIAWERQAGPPVNRAMAQFYDWLVLVVGPATVVFGVGRS